MCECAKCVGAPRGTSKCAVWAALQAGFAPCLLRPRLPRTLYATVEAHAAHATPNPGCSFECKSDGQYFAVQHVALEPAGDDIEESAYTGPVRAVAAS